MKGDEPMKKVLMLSLLLILLATVAAYSTEKNKKDSSNAYQAYQKVIQDTAAMVSNSDAQTLARHYGLNILNVTWEDTGRYKGSSVGPNISDMTIQVQQRDLKTQQYSLTCMPVIRYPNFEDKSADISPDRFYLMVGNEKGRSLRKVTLKHFLENIRSYLNKPDSWKGNGRSLLAKRDTHVLVSAQACFLPIPKQGIAEFNPVLFNYVSYEGDPGVLTIMATREGTSVTVIDNKRDAFQAGWAWGQRLFFNQKGERASLTGKRLSDYVAETKGNQQGSQGTAVQAGKESGLNMVLLIQVPLLQKRPLQPQMACPSASCDKCESAGASRSNVEAAVIGHGKVEGPFTEIAGLEIKRDEKYPIRVTVQFYKATGNGVVSIKDIRDVADQITRVYSQADYVGSLVTGGITKRPTEYDGPKSEPPGWWDAFWKRHQMNTGLTPEETLDTLRKLYGPNWKPGSPEDFEKAIKKLELRKSK